jgi:hypothetical protein
MVSATAKSATVPIKSATQSKINWTALVGPALSALAYFGLKLDPQQAIAVIAGIQAAQSIVTIVLKTYFTKTVTPDSVGQ